MKIGDERERQKTTTTKKKQRQKRPRRNRSYVERVKDFVVHFYVLFATSQTHSICNSNFYYPIDGVAMGSPLAFVLANIFMGFYKSKWLNEYNLNKPKFYLRYVDDILAAFDNEQDSLNF